MKRISAIGLLIVILTMGAACSPKHVSAGAAEHQKFSVAEHELTVVSSTTNLELVPSKPTTGGEPGEITVTRWFTASKMVGNVRADWSMDDDTLRLGITCSGFVTECEARHRVEVPSDVKVKVQATDGSIAASGFSAPLDLKVTNGNINVDEAGSPLTLRADDGSIRAEKLKTASVSATARNGYVILGFAKAPTTVRTDVSDGNTTIKAPRTDYDVATKVSDGKTKVTLPKKKGADRTIDAEASNGSITIRARK